MDTSLVQKQKLACDLVKDQFGDLVYKVLHHLVHRGRATLQELGRATQQPPAALKSCLLSLLQHNCIDAYKDDTVAPDINKAALAAQVVYVALLERIIQRLRHPRFMVHVREMFGERHETILQSLLEHGRLRGDQIIDYTAAKEGKRVEETQRGVEECFTELVAAHYIERAPLVSSAAAAGHAVVGAAAKRRGGAAPRPGTAAAAAAEAEAASRQANAARSAMERFRLPARLQAVVNRKRKRVAAGEEEQLAENDDDFGEEESRRMNDPDRDTLWRVNHDEFNRRFRHLMCIALVAEKVEPAAGAVMAAMLRVSREHELHAVEDRSVPVSDAEVQGAMAALAEEGAPAIDGANVRPVLHLLLSDTSELISQTAALPDGGLTVCANLKRIMDLVRLKEVEAAVRDRFGPSACRIFRLLVLKRQLEQKQIAEMAMLPVKDTRTILYKLLKGNYVTLQEVSKTGDHNPQRTFYVWRVDMSKAVAKLGAELLMAVSHVRARLAHELHTEKEVLELLEKATGAGDAEAKERVTLTTAQRNKLEYVRRVAAVLETRLLHLDNLLLLLHDA